jgi:hypothetical protein
VEAFSEFNLQTPVQDKGKKAEISWETPSMSSTAPLSDSASMAAADRGWSDWIWREQFNSYERSRKKPDGNWEYDYALPQPAAGSSPSAPGGYTIQYSKAAGASLDTAGQTKNSSRPTALQSSLCAFVNIISRSEKTYRCSLSGGEEIQLRVDGWIPSTIDYSGDAVSCWAYTGKSGAVYYTWNFDMTGKGRKK